MYKTVAKAWRHRVFGRRAGLYFWVLWGGALFGVVGTHPSGRWALYAGFGLGGTAVAWHLLPDALMPGWIFNWQVGAWGEKNTASELKPLNREGWVIRHDLASPRGGNRDHLVAGPAVFLLDTKNLADSSISIEGSGLRVSRLEDPNQSYLIDRFPVQGSAHGLASELRAALGFRVAVYPVLVVWGQFNTGEAWIGDLAVVDGRHIADWLRRRPADLVREDKRQAVADWARSLPQA